MGLKNWFTRKSKNERNFERIQNQEKNKNRSGLSSATLAGRFRSKNNNSNNFTSNVGTVRSGQTRVANVLNPRNNGLAHDPVKREQQLAAKKYLETMRSDLKTVSDSDFNMLINFLHYLESQLKNTTQYGGIEEFSEYSSDVRRKKGFQPRPKKKSSQVEEEEEEQESGDDIGDYISLNIPRSLAILLVLVIKIFIVIRNVLGMFLTLFLDVITSSPIYLLMLASTLAELAN
jgi:hypothetical protein